MIHGTETFEFIQVSPQMAAEWLTRNATGQRNLRRAIIATWAKDMRAGRWQRTHQPICFNQKGELVDGQHRLSAVIESGVAVPLLVAKNFTLKVTDSIDIGQNRSLTFLTGLSNRKIASLNNLRWMIDGGRGVMKRSTPGIIGKIKSDFENEVSAVWELSGDSIHGAVMAAAIYTFPIAPAKVERFLIQVRDGEMLNRNDPPYRLRDWAERHKRALHSERIFAACNTLRYTLCDLSMSSVYMTDLGYRAIVTERRRMTLRYTPDSSTVTSEPLQPKNRDDVFGNDS